MRSFLRLFAFLVIIASACGAETPSRFGTLLCRFTDDPSNPPTKLVQIVRTDAPGAAVTITSFERGGSAWFSPDEKWLVIVKNEFSGSAVPELYRHKDGAQFERVKVDVSQRVLDDYRERTGDQTKANAHELFCRMFGWSDDSKTFRVGLFSKHGELNSSNWGARISVDPFSIKPEVFSEETLLSDIQAAELAKADTELNAIYNLLRGGLDEFERGALKAAQLVWLKERDRAGERALQLIDERVQTLCAAFLQKDVGLATAFSDITTWERIGMLRVGMPEDDLMAALGDEPKIGEEFEEGATGMFVREFTFPKKGVSLWMASEKKGGKKAVTSINLKAPGDMTTGKGIGIGAPKAKVLEAYGHLSAANTEPGDEMFTAGSEIGQMSFFFENGVVARIWLGPGPE